MTAYGVDEAWAKLTPAQLLAAGKAFVVGYVSENGSKNLTKSNVDAYHGAGVAVLLVYEYSTTAAETGAAGGTRNATLAVQLAKALGYPRGCAIAFAIDEGSPNLNSLAAYARAFAAVCHANGYRCMVYGGYTTVKYCLDHGLVDLGWQTYAWSNGRWDPRAAIRQVRNGVRVNGVDVDFDTAMTTDYGAWMPGAGQGDDMTGDEHNLLVHIDAMTGNMFREFRATLAADATRDQAALAAIQALAAGGTSVDTGAVIARINEVAAAESAAVAALHTELAAAHAQVADLQAKLAAAGHALG